MLQYRTVYPATLELLKNLMQIPELKDFYLVGGTALALQLGHRISVDLDLFTEKDFNTEKIINKLEKQFSLTNLIKQENTLNLNIIFPENSENSIKIDLIKYSYPLINPVLEIDRIRLLSTEDIIPMKLSAIAGRGSKKDFYDIFFLLKSYSLDKMFDLFSQKFPNTNQFHVLKSLTYFDDADIEPNPQTHEKTNWVEIKKAIINETTEFINM